jgi:excisionase family DNA binding protein
MTAMPNARSNGKDGRTSFEGPPPDDGATPVLMTPGEVAAVLHVDANTLARWSKTGKLTAVFTPGGHRRYLMSEVLRMTRRRRSAVPPHQP